MALSAYETFAEEPLRFPIGSKVYELKPVGIEAGLKLAGVLTGRDKEFGKKPAEEAWKLVLGDLWDTFIADGVPLEAATRAGLCALADYQYGREAAEAAWEAGADPKALEAYLMKKAPNRASRRSLSTGAGTTTRKRAGTSGTNSQKK